MIPPALSHDILSLKAEQDRPAISLLARFDPDGHLQDYRFTPSLIRVRHRMTYEEVDQSIEQEPLSEMFRLCQTLRQKRMDQGALDLSLPELQFKFNGSSLLAVELLDPTMPSRRIVSELMIFYNHLAARFCKENQIPILYRTQAAPSERLELESDKYIYYVFQQRRKLSPLLIDTEAKPHSSLGLEAYTQGTSPIRRYLDLVVQRQIRDALMETAPFHDSKGLDEIRISVEPVLKRLELIKRSRLRYWTLKFLRQHMDRKYKAVILDELRRGYRVVLCDVLLVAEMKRQDGVLFRPGQEIRVAVKQIDPWEGTIDLVCADQ
jgi:exoribonuclease-2